MKALSRLICCLTVAWLVLGVAGVTLGQEAAKVDASKADEAPKPKFPPFDKLLKDAKKIDGLIPLYRTDGKLYGEISGAHFNKDFIVLISIARGIGEGALLGGMTWGFGDDWLWQFRRVDDRVHIVRRNVRFTADKSSPEANAVELAYTDSILFSLPIATMSPAGNVILDLTPIFMSDLPQIQRVLPGFGFSSDRSTWAATKGFKDNIELTVAATYASPGVVQFDTVADSRAVTINVHYSISLLPQTGYKPRLADDRVGYFLTVIKDFSKKGDDDRFVRYINRWDLQKADPNAAVSPPKKPIVFWLEKTIPYPYRAPIRDGILEWNKAFEKAGFVNAIEVRQQPDNADWDPEDINYNTFRWITAGAGFAMGPSRVNPLTGQILDADIIFDADFIEYWKHSYETFTPAGIAAMTGGPLDLRSYQEELQRRLHEPHHHLCRCEYHQGMAREFAFGAAALAVQHADAAQSKEMEEKMITQGLKEVTMHEVGHTLGLRHNFKASTWLTLEEINNPQITREKGMVASVMDYSPINLVPKGKQQGDYYSTTIGPYDTWAIEYGYKPLSGGTQGEYAELKKIAARCAEPGLSYATDEDTRGIDSDPLSNRFDLGKDPLEFAQTRVETVQQLWDGLLDRVTEEGDGFQRARRAFGILLSTHGVSTYYASRYVGGLYVHRDHKGDPNGRPPFVVVEPQRQRQALELLEQNLFNDKPFQFPPELYNHLAASRWSHWGVPHHGRLDYAVHEVIGMWQDRALYQLLSPLTLARLHDSELKVPADQDAFTVAELFGRLSAAIFAELDQLKPGEYTPRKPAIASLRRNLQRMYLRRLSEIALGNTGAPQDCQTLAYAELGKLQEKIRKALEADNKLDAYTLAHLTESADRIEKVRSATLTISRP